jgi:altronate dehydratase
MEGKTGSQFGENRTGRRDTFLGFQRGDGSVGTRNFIAGIPTVFCANEVAAEKSRYDRTIGIFTLGPTV